MVIVKELITKNKIKTLFPACVEFLQTHPLQDVIMAFLESKPLVANPLFLFLKQQRYTFEFAALSYRELQPWILHHVAGLNGKIQPQAATLLAGLVGNDLFQLDLEIRKLIAYTSDRVILPKDVTALVHGNFDENIFHFFDALYSQDARKACKLLSDQTRAGTSNIGMIGMMARQIRILLMVKSLLTQENGSLSAENITKKLSLHPFVVQKSLVQASRFSLPKLKKLYRLLLKVEELAKSDTVSASATFDLFVARVLSVKTLDF